MLYCDSRCSQTLTGLSLALPGAVLCNATRRLGDRQRVILRQRVRGSIRAVRAVRNTRVFQTETWVVADVDASKTLEADFNIPTIHVMCHWVEQICRYRALQQYSAERHEYAHKTILKDGWNASNHNLNYLPQDITFHHPILCIRIREFKLRALTLDSENSTAKCKVLPSGANLAALLCSLSYAKPEFMGPQNRCDGNHPDTIIKDFRALINNIQDPPHCMAIYSGTHLLIKQKSRDKMYISDEPLHTMELCI
jgi:hypothetical protein